VLREPMARKRSPSPRKRERGAKGLRQKTGPTQVAGAQTKRRPLRAAAVAVGKDGGLRPPLPSNG